jgi:hypothetical protein
MFESEVFTVAQTTTFDQFFSFFFGQKLREGLLVIPLLLLASFAIAYLVYIKTAIFTEGKIKTTAMKNLDKLVRIIVAVIFFFVPLIVNRLQNFNFAIVALVIEISVLFLIVYYIQQKRKLEVLKI